MLILRSKLIGAKVVDFRTQSILGTVSDIIFDEKIPALRGFALNNGIVGKTKVVPVQEVLEITKEFIVINDDEAIMPLSENISLENLVKKCCYGANQIVITRSGRKIGKVYDFLIDANTMNIVKYYIKNIFHDHIIPSYRIIQFSAKKLIIKEDYETGTIREPAMETVQA